MLIRVQTVSRSLPSAFCRTWQPLFVARRLTITEEFLVVVSPHHHTPLHYTTKMASNSSTDTTIIVYPPQTEINLRLLTALAHEETSHLEFHCPCPLSKKINEQLRWHADMRREDEWMRKMQQREGIARAKRAANREAKRQGKMKTL
jgi:hypothetical protein